MFQIKTSSFQVLTLSILFLIASYFLILPVAARAQLVVCDGVEVECTVDKFVEEVQVVINYIIFIIVPSGAGVVLAVGGYRLVGNRGNAEEVKKFWELFRTVIVGVLIVYSCWLVVYSIVEFFINPQFEIPEELRLDP